SEHDAKDALSKLLQMGPVAEYQNVDEYIGVDEASSAIDGVFVVGESDVESMDVPSKVILVLKEGGGELDDSLDEINLSLSEEFMIRVLEGRHVSGEKSREATNFSLHVNRDMLADENVSQAVIELDDATKHAEEISKEISPQVDGQKNAHREYARPWLLGHLKYRASRSCLRLYRSLSTLHFLKILKNSLEVLKVVKNSLEVLKVLRIELQEKSSIDEPIPKRLLAKTKFTKACGLLPPSVYGVQTHKIVDMYVKDARSLVATQGQKRMMLTQVFWLPCY
nr:hypothetical protein [Tanacetum cinerariifolium]